MESRNCTDEPICREGMETQMQRTRRGKERVGHAERAALTHTHNHV